MLNIEIDYAATDYSLGRSGQLKRVNGVNGLPKSAMPGFPDLQNEFFKMGISEYRLHDMYGVGDIDNFFDSERAVDNDQLTKLVPDDQRSRARKFVVEFGNLRTIFPNAALGMQENDSVLAASNPNYAIMDDYLVSVLSYAPLDRDIIIRIGRTNNAGYEVPENVEIYGDLAAKLVARYARDSFATGLPKKISYWEIWNEPDLSMFWNENNPQVYYDFYRIISLKMKQIDPTIKVGATSIANGYFPNGPYNDQFMSYCRIHNVPLDFFSWHYYGHMRADPKLIINIANTVDESLTRNGFRLTESFCTEWNSTPFGTINVFSKVQSAQNAAYIASTLMCMQACRVDRAYYYRGDSLSFGLFNNDTDSRDPYDQSGNPSVLPTTYAGQAFAVFNELLETPTILKTTDTTGTPVTILAGKKNNLFKVLVANFVPDKRLTSADDPPINDKFYRQYYIDSSRSVDQLTDAESMGKYFGGVDPNSMSSNNEVLQKPLVAEIYNPNALPLIHRDATESQHGISLTIKNMPYQVIRAQARRIFEGGSLAELLPESVRNASVEYVGSDLVIKDALAVDKTVTLFTFALSDEPFPPPPPPEPEPEPEPKKFSRTLYGEKPLHPISFRGQLPPTFQVVAGERYRITMSNNSLGIRRIMLPVDRIGFTVLTRGLTGPNILESSVIVLMTDSGPITQFFDGWKPFIRVKTFGPPGRPYAMTLTIEQILN